MKKKIIIFLIISVAVVAAVILYYPNTPLATYFTLLWFCVVAALLWLVNRLITRMLDRIIPWSRGGNIRFFVHLIVGIIGSLLTINVSYLILKYSLTVDPPTVEQLVVMNVWGTLIFIPAFSVYFSLHFLKYWRKAELEVTRFQKESIRAQLESIKNHLDPHFLFNNLNILSSLIDRDVALSKTFLEKFGDVYRSLLRSKADDLITLRDELAFMQSYIFLIKIRFEKNIQFDINIPDSLYESMLPPLTLQMLTENAIKHNKITETKPLIIRFFQEDNYLVVENTFQSKILDDNERSGSGLTAIQQRYQFFTDVPVVVDKQEHLFVVKVPLLTIETL